MEKLEEYRQHARQCRELAAQMEHEEQRKQLLEMAATWERLAEDRTKIIRSR
jgi:hypothetical protein